MTQLSNVVNIYKSHEKPIHIRNDSPRLTAAFAQAQSLKYISINFWNLIFFISFVLNAKIVLWFIIFSAALFSFNYDLRFNFLSLFKCIFMFWNKSWNMIPFPLAAFYFAFTYFSVFHLFLGIFLFLSLIWFNNIFFLIFLFCTLNFFANSF